MHQSRGCATGGNGSLADLLTNITPTAASGVQPQPVNATFCCPTIAGGGVENDAKTGVYYSEAQKDYD